MEGEDWVGWEGWGGGRWGGGVVEREEAGPCQQAHWVCRTNESWRDSFVGDARRDKNENLKKTKKKKKKKHVDESLRSRPSSTLPLALLLGGLLRGKKYV